MYQNPDHTDVWVNKDIQRRVVSVVMVVRRGDKTYAPEPVVMKQIELAETVNPIMNIPFEDIPQLMDELWASGFRPSHEASTGQIAATQAHLKDMQTMAFGFSEVLVGMLEGKKKK